MLQLPQHTAPICLLCKKLTYLGGSGCSLIDRPQDLNSLLIKKYLLNDMPFRQTNEVIRKNQ